MMPKLSRSARALLCTGALAAASFAIAMPAFAETDDGVEVLVGIPTSTSNTVAPSTSAPATATSTGGATNTAGTGSSGSNTNSGNAGNSGSNQLATTGTEGFLALGLSASAITLAGAATLLTRRRLGSE